MGRSQKTFEHCQKIKQMAYVNRVGLRLMGHRHWLKGKGVIAHERGVQRGEIYRV
jgi:hypothetical protein